jgi:hypothetical protein
VNDSLNNETQNRQTNDSYLQGQIDNKLNISDQRYNDTALINQTNYTIWLELDNKLNITDQRYNDTALINAVNTTLNIESLGFNTTVQNYNLFLNLSDQRYNDTQLVLDVNSTIKQPLSPYIVNNTSSFWINETYLNTTINNISKVRQIIYNMTCTTISGDCNVTSLTNITYQITRVTVTPNTITDDYNFELTEYPNTANIIDANRQRHKDTIWDIEKAYTINGQVNAKIINSQLNELFTISITYLTNGVTP